MIDSVRIRRQGAMDFRSHYDYLCVLQDSVPLQAVKANLRRGALSFNADRVKLSDWPPILNTLKINKSLTSVAIKSCHQPGLGESDSDKYGVHFRRRIPPIRSKDMTFQLCRALAACLTVSSSLKELELHGLPLRERDLITLAKGLAASSSLESLALPYCSCGDEGLKIICKSVKNSPTIKVVDFTGCNLTWHGAEWIASIVKHQATRRHSEAWAESLRYRRPDLDCMTGLRRISLNCNMLVGDQGAMALADVLGEDLWLKALDMRQCGISSEGAKAFLRALQANTTLMILDIRKNPLIDHSLLKTVIERVLLNAHDTHSEYKWFCSPAREGSKVKRSTTLRNGLKGKNTIRIGMAAKKTFVSGIKCTPKEFYSPEPKTPGEQGFLPWRTAERANRHREMSSNSAPEQIGTPLKVSVCNESSMDSDDSEISSDLIVQEPASCQILKKSSVKNYKRLQVALQECQLMFEEERKTRLRADDRIMELEVENTRLRQINRTLSEALEARNITSVILEDDCVLDSIEKSFNKFHAFLDLLKDAGLGQLASLAGIDQSDFVIPGDPQLSSTIERAQHPLSEIVHNLQRTYFVDQADSRDNGIVPPDSLGESYTADATANPPLASDEVHATSEKSKGEVGLDLSLKNVKTSRSSGNVSKLQSTKDADIFKESNQSDSKEASSECSASESRSRKSPASSGSKQSASSKHRKPSSKRSLSKESSRAPPDLEKQNSYKASVFSGSSVESEIPDNFNSAESKHSVSN